MRKPHVLSLSVQNLAHFPQLPSRSKIQRWISRALENDAQITVRFVEEEEGRELNKTYRSKDCLLYTSDAADEEDSVDLGGRRIIKKKNIHEVKANVQNEKDEITERIEWTNDMQTRKVQNKVRLNKRS